MSEKPVYIDPLSGEAKRVYKKKKPILYTHPAKPPGWSPIGFQGQFSRLEDRAVLTVKDLWREVVTDLWPIEEGAKPWQRIAE